MLAYNKDLFVRIQEAQGVRAPVPQPLESGFSLNRLYRVLGVYSPSETAEAYFILPNDRDEIWFISQRHVRFGLLKQTEAHHLPLPAQSLPEFKRLEHSDCSEGIQAVPANL
ncbi:hypothetical protein DESA109040_18005 [Deinococcus saxicola]|uniref:hypothetical protein n=1 Tax=Deinococcus saxicola TaxID=249406 RepID=UPI0039EDE9C1